MHPRRATAQDVPHIEALVNGAYGKYIARIGRKPKPMLADYRAALERHQLWVCDGENGLAAVLELIPGEAWLLIENIAVSPQVQRMGLGRALMAFAEGEALRQGFSELRLYTNAKFTENIALYLTLGYLETSREPYGDSIVVHMAKPV